MTYHYPTAALMAMKTVQQRRKETINSGHCFNLKRNSYILSYTFMGGVSIYFSHLRFIQQYIFSNRDQNSKYLSSVST